MKVITNLQIAVDFEYQKRKARITHPEGIFDKGGRWYPSAAERQDCCDAVRSPSRSFPWSYMTHCRSKKHIVNLYMAHPERFDLPPVATSELVEFHPSDKHGVN